MAAYYLVVAIGALIVYAIVGLLTADRLLLLAEMVPVVLVGFTVASKLVERTNDRVLRP